MNKLKVIWQTVERKRVCGLVLRGDKAEPSDFPISTTAVGAASAAAGPKLPLDSR